jgi:hypothetical protein
MLVAPTTALPIPAARAILSLPDAVPGVPLPAHSMGTANRIILIVIADG